MKLTDKQKSVLAEMRDKNLSIELTNHWGGGVSWFLGQKLIPSSTFHALRDRELIVATNQDEGEFILNPAYKNITDKL